MVPVPKAPSLEELNQRILAECLSYGTHTINGLSKTVNELFESEKDSLIENPDIPFSKIQIYDGKADKYATVIVDKNRYSVPTTAHGQFYNGAGHGQRFLNSFYQDSVSSREKPKG